MSNRADDFNRSNGVLNGATPSDGGAAWTAVNYSVESNRLRCTALGYAYEYAYTESSSSVGEASVNLAVKGQSIGPALRVSDENGYFVLFVVGNQLQLYKRINSTTISQIGSTYSGTISAGDVIKLGVDSSSQFTGYQNGTARVGPVTDSFNSAATKVGVICFSSASGARLDDFSFTDLAGGGGDVTVSLSGSQSSSGAGSLGPASSVGVSGSSVSSSAGSITAALSVSVSGASAASAAGTLAPSLSVALSGASASASAGTVSTGNDVAVSLSGQQATTAAGSLGVAVQVALSGASTAAAAGAVVPGISLSLSGSAATAYAGTITPSVNNDVVVGLSGSESIADAGIVVASGGTAATRSAGFEMVGHKPSRRLWWMRKPKNLTEEEAEEALEDVAEAIVDKVAEQVAKKAPADKVKKAVKEAVKPVAEKMPGFDWAAFYKQAFEAAQQAQQEQERTQAAIRNYIVKAMADAQRRRIEQDDEDIELLAMML